MKFKFIGDSPTVFVDVQLATGETLLAEPDKVYDLDAKTDYPSLIEVTKAPATSAETPLIAPEPPAN